jgi:hypothetical protein
MAEGRPIKSGHRALLIGAAAARGYWIPVALGWMTHIYPEGKTLDERWFGRQMIAIEAGLPPGYTCTSVPPQ